MLVVAFQIVLLIIIVISFIGIVGEKDKALQEKMSITFLGSLIGFVLSVLWM